MIPRAGLKVSARGNKQLHAVYLRPVQVKSKGNLFPFPVIRGDVFDLPEENMTSTVSPTMAKTSTPILNPDAETCSGRSFDAFLQTKNGSIYAFRGELPADDDECHGCKIVTWTCAPVCCTLGEYFFELDEKSVMAGYPKLIKDVWGIPGPIDAAFTRINCQGKTYIFKVYNDFQVNLNVHPCLILV